MGPRRPSDEASGPVCIQQIHHMNTRLYTGLVALRCARRRAEEEDRRRGEGLVFPNINTNGNHLRPALSYDRTATLPRATPRDANGSSVGVHHLQATWSCRQWQQLLKWIDSVCQSQKRSVMSCYEVDMKRCWALPLWSPYCHPIKRNGHFFFQVFGTTQKKQFRANKVFCIVHKTQKNYLDHGIMLMLGIP